MITYYFIFIIGMMINAIMSLFLPIVTISSIPIVGPSVYSVLVTVVSTWNAFLVTFPYAALPWKLFLFVILPFELLLLVAKLILGHRLPISHAN